MSPKKKAPAKTIICTAFHGSAALKRQLLKTLEQHRLADAYISGSYGSETEKYRLKGFKGCAVGCTLHSMKKLTKTYKGAQDEDGPNGEKGFYRHEDYPLLLGLPEGLAHLQDGIFESYGAEDCDSDSYGTDDCGCHLCTGFVPEEAKKFSEAFFSAINVGAFFSEDDMRQLRSIREGWMNSQPTKKELKAFLAALSDVGPAEFSKPVK